MTHAVTLHFAFLAKAKVAAFARYDAPIISAINNGVCYDVVLREHGGLYRSGESVSSHQWGVHLQKLGKERR